MSPLNLSKTPKQPSTPWAFIPQLQWGNTTNRCTGQDFPFNRSVINGLKNHCANARKYKDPVTWLLPHHLALFNLIPRIGVLFDRTFKNCVPLLMPYYVVPQTFGDSLTHFAYVWRAITMGKWVLEIVCSDCTTESVLSPHHKDPFHLFSHEEILCQKADSLLQRGSVDHMPPQYEGKGVPKKKWRMEYNSWPTPTEGLYSKIQMLHGPWALISSHEQLDKTSHHQNSDHSQGVSFSTRPCGLMFLCNTICQAQPLLPAGQALVCLLTRQGQHE